MSTVSIIITTFSRPSLLPRAVASAFAAGSDVEVIVVDDASTDETAEVCSKLGRIKYIRLDKNLGTARARNAGIDASLGQFISFHDDDDRKLPGTLDELTAILEANPNAGLAYGQTWAGNDELEPKGEPFPLVCYQGDVFWRLIEANFISPIATVFRKACLEDVGIIDPNLVGVDDYDLWIRIAERYEILALEKPVGVWREASLSSGQGSSDRVLEVLRTNEISNRALTELTRCRNDDGRRESARTAIKKRTSEFLFWYAFEQYKLGRMSDTRRSLLAGLKFDPKRVIRPGVARMLIRSLMNL